MAMGNTRYLHSYQELDEKINATNACTVNVNLPLLAA